MVPGKPVACAKFCQNWSIRCRDIAIFRLFNIAAAAVLNFQNREIIYANGIQSGSRHISMPNFVKISRSVAMILRFFNFFNHFGFAWGIFGPTTESTWGLYHSAKFGLIDAVVLII